MSFFTILYNIILSPITQIIEITYKAFNKMFNNTGIAILGVSLAVTLLCLPLYIIAESWQDKERAIQGKMSFWVTHIKKYFKGDEQYMILNNYYRLNHYHPIMSLRSSFGILIQIPFFLAAYHTLSSLPDLQGRSFLFIKDMGKSDSVFSLGTFRINILPIAMTIINCISGTIYSRGHSIKEKNQIYGMAAIFLAVLYDSPAGLVLYWTMNNIFSLVKNVFYKMKNPLKILYLCAVAVIIFFSFYILFLYGGVAKLKKRLVAVIFLLFWIPIPYYVRILIYLSEKTLSTIFNDKKSRFKLFAFSALGLCILNGLVLPSELIKSSVQEFSNIESYTNPNAFIHSSFWMSFGLFIFWSSCIYFLFKNRLQTLIAFLFATAFLSAIANSYIFNGNYGSMDVTLRFIDGFANPSKRFMLLNIFVLFTIFVIVICAIKFKFQKILSIILFSTIPVFVILYTINTSKITNEYNAFSNSQSQKTELTSKFSISKSQPNIMIFMLDRFESAFVPQILKDFPLLSDLLDGFIFYKNMCSPNGHTLISSPTIYGGYDYTPDKMNERKNQTLKEKHNEAILMLPSLLSENGFHSYLSDISWANYSYISDMNFAKEKNFITPMTLMGRYSGEFKKETQKPGFEKSSLAHLLNRNLFYVSLFRESPAVLRPVIYYKGTWWENGVQESSGAFSDWYSALYYLKKITSVDAEKPSLLIIANEATHSNDDISMYNLEMDGNFSTQDNAYKIDCLTLNEIAKFISYLKENDCYDNTRIILVSDHGIGRNEIAKELYKTADLNGYNKDHLNALLMVKDFNSHGSLSTDMTFMTTADVPSLALKSIVENPVNPFTKNLVTMESKKEGFKVTTADLFMPHQSKSNYEFTVPKDSWYLVKENIFVDENWKQLD